MPQTTLKKVAFSEMVHEREVPKNDPGRKGGLLMSPDSSANVDEDSDSKTDLFD